MKDMVNNQNSPLSSLPLHSPLPSPSPCNDCKSSLESESYLFQFLEQMYIYVESMHYIQQRRTRIYEELKRRKEEFNYKSEEIRIGEDSSSTSKIIKEEESQLEFLLSVSCWNRVYKYLIEKSNSELNRLWIFVKRAVPKHSDSCLISTLCFSSLIWKIRLKLTLNPLVSYRTFIETLQHELETKRDSNIRELPSVFHTFCCCEIVDPLLPTVYNTPLLSVKQISTGFTIEQRQKQYKNGEEKKKGKKVATLWKIQKTKVGRKRITSICKIKDLSSSLYQEMLRNRKIEKEEQQEQLRLLEERYPLPVWRSEQRKSTSKSKSKLQFSSKALILATTIGTKKEKVSTLSGLGKQYISSFVSSPNFQRCISLF